MLEKMNWIYHFICSSFQSKILVKMMDRDRYIVYRERYIAKVYGKKIKASSDVNKILLDKLKNNEPFAVCRNGMDETIFLTKMQRDDIMGTHSAEKMSTMPIMLDNNKEFMRMYYDMMNKLYRNADFIVNWRSLNMEEFYYRQFRDNAEFCYDDGVSNFLLKDPNSWIYGIEGKKVLVISPFTDYIEEQYKKKDLLWTGIRIPEFELHTVKSVFWYEGFKDPRFDNWFEVLDYVYEEAMKQDFDIALLGCGPISTPLALKFKQQGKQAVHVGGPLQLMFGIKGKRWDQYFQDTYNEHWITLPEETKAGNVDKLDVKGGSYW